MRRKLTPSRLEGALDLTIPVQTPVIAHLLCDFISKDFLDEIAHVALEASREDNDVCLEMRPIIELETFFRVANREGI